jgi:hypothetical protein
MNMATAEQAIGFDFVVVFCFRLIEACAKQEIGSQALRFVKDPFRKRL